MPWTQEAPAWLMTHQVFDYAETMVSLTVIYAIAANPLLLIRDKVRAPVSVLALMTFFLPLFAEEQHQRDPQIALPLMIFGGASLVRAYWKEASVAATGTRSRARCSVVLGVASALLGPNRGVQTVTPAWPPKAQALSRDPQFTCLAECWQASGPPHVDAKSQRFEETEGAFARRDFEESGSKIRGTTREGIGSGALAVPTIQETPVFFACLKTMRLIKQVPSGLRRQ